MSAIIIGFIGLFSFIILIIYAACKVMRDVHTGFQVYREDEEEYDGYSGEPLQHPSNFTDYR
jgi:hypothetical protein